MVSTISLGCGMIAGAATADGMGSPIFSILLGLVLVIAGLSLFGAWLRISEAGDVQ